MLPAKVHRGIYLVLLALLGGSMVTSVWLSNLAWVLLGANWVLEGWSRPDGSNWHSTWREKWQMARSSSLLHAFVALYLLHLAGMLWTTHTADGLGVLQVKLPLLVVPLVLLTSRPVTGRARQAVLAIYAATVLTVSIIATVRLLTIPDLPYREAVPHISHIRFALNCCMVVYLAALGALGRLGHLRLPMKIACLVLMLWMLFFLALIHSYTAFAILALVSLVLVLVHRRWPLAILWLLVAAGAACLVGREAKAYYRLIPQATQPLATHTAAGHPYIHYRDGIIENGNYINNYLCPDEMRAEWQRRSTMSYDSVGDDGYSLQPTLVRYLNALGLTKDSVGVHSLTDAQVADVERGVANPVYLDRNPVRKMVYVILFEREYYVHTHAVRGFTMLQRFELWRATLDVVRDHPWWGVGTGDVDHELHARLAAMQSSLADTRKSTHNQYLAFLAAFGIAGFALLLLMFLRPLFGTRHPATPDRLKGTATSRTLSPFSALQLAWLLTILISCLTEDTLSTLAGILFCTYFLAFRTPQCTNTTPSATESE